MVWKNRFKEIKWLSHFNNNFAKNTDDRYILIVLQVDHVTDKISKCPRLVPGKEDLYKFFYFYPTASTTIKNLEVSEKSHIFILSFQPLVFNYPVLKTASLELYHEGKDCFTRPVFCSFKTAVAHSHIFLKKLFL